MLKNGLVVLTGASDRGNEKMGFIVETQWPQRYTDVRKPFAIVKHRDAYGHTWYYATNRNGQVATGGFRDVEGAAKQVGLMLTAFIRLPKSF